MNKNEKYIEIHIDSNGQTTIEAFGYEGNSCERATASLEDALGHVESRERKPEYYKNQRIAEESRLRRRP
ncbi:DUF2997 domain-containing protein [Brevibacillus reuszeri]|uniref:DUF2997 domain-containing protein n=1 Tax=Brevibacillus reuszeri TaxID=54915 RepID=UPI000CCBF401|nr:DUF2997 domain-containing protein [Brevibacillus reuszeri]